MHHTMDGSSSHRTTTGGRRRFDRQQFMLFVVVLSGALFARQQGLVLSSVSFFEQLQDQSYYVANTTIMKSEEQDSSAVDQEQQHSSVATGGAVTAEKSHQHDASEDPSNSLSSCLLIMDDNHWLVEWIAFHFSMWNLRKMIVAVDPRSQTSPSPILNRWKDLISIQVWDDASFDFQEPTEGNLQDVNLKRQFSFLAKCMVSMKEQGSTWTIFTDTDELLGLNPDVWNPTSELYRPFVPRMLNETGVLFQIMKKEAAYSNTSCLAMPRVQFSPTESDSSQVNREIPKGFHGEDFLSLRWIHRDKPLPGPKNVVDLSVIPWSDIPRTTTFPHRVIEQNGYCEDPRPLKREPRVVEANHYFGTREQFEFRDDARKGMKNKGRNSRFDKYFNNSKSDLRDYDILRPWLGAFVRQVGTEEATRLLDKVGQTKGWKSEANET